MRGQIVFLDQQLEDRKRELEAAEQRRLAFEAEHPDITVKQVTFPYADYQTRIVAANMARKAGGQPHCISCTTPRARDSIRPGSQDMASGCSRK